MLLGGRAAEMLVFNEGPQRPWTVDDFSKATNIARNMVTRFGMHEKLGLVTYRRRGRLSSARMRLAHFAERECNSNPAGASIYLGWPDTDVDRSSPSSDRAAYNRKFIGFALLARQLLPMRLRDHFRVGHPCAKGSMHFQSEHAHFGPFSRSSGHPRRGAMETCSTARPLSRPEWPSADRKSARQ